MQAYFWALADEPAEAIQQAVRVWMKTEKWFPKPSELIALANDISGPQALPAPEPRQRTPEGYESLLRIADLAKRHNVKLHPKVVAAIDEARTWWKDGAA